MAETWVQLGFQVLPMTDTTVHRLAENPIPLGRFATLWEFAIAIMLVTEAELKKNPHCAQALNSEENRAVRGAALGILLAVPLGVLKLA